MKILVLCNKFPYPARDGSSRAVLNTLQALHHVGHTLTVVAINTHKHFVDPEQLPQEWRNKATWISIEAHTDPTPWGALLNLFSRESYLASRFMLPALKDALVEMRQDPPDVVVLEGVFMGHYVPFLQGIPVVLRPHNVEHLIWERHLQTIQNPFIQFYLRLQAKRLKAWETEVAQSVQGILPLSAEDARFFRGVAPNIPIQPLGVPFEVAAQPAPESPNLVFHALASWDWLPNMEGLQWFLASIWPRVLAAAPSAQLHVGGRGFEKSDLPKGVSYHGLVDDAKAFSLSHGIMVVPLLAGSGLRMKVGEGLSLGIPMISTTVGAEGYGLVHNKHLLLADDPQEFAAAMLRLGTNVEWRHDLAVEALNYAKHHLQTEYLAGEMSKFLHKVKTAYHA